MAAISQTTFSNAFYWMKMCEFPLRFHWSLFLIKDLINNIPALVQIMAWRRPGDKPLSEATMVRLPTHICVTWPQWVKKWQFCSACGTGIFTHFKINDQVIRSAAMFLAYLIYSVVMHTFHAMRCFSKWPHHFKPPKQPQIILLEMKVWHGSLSDQDTIGGMAPYVICAHYDIKHCHRNTR